MRSADVHFVRFWFTDVLGVLKSFAVTDTELEGAFEEGMGFDGSSIDGFTRIQESDMVAFPNPETFQVLPWRPGEKGVGRMFCDIMKPDGTPFEGDPRYALKRMLKKAADMGYTMYVGPELEFFYFADARAPRSSTRAATSTSRPLDVASDLRRDTVLTLEKMGIPVEYSPPRGRPVAARDRPSLPGRADDGRHRHDLPPGRQGDRATPTACTPRSCRSPSRARTARACTRTSRCSPRTATRSSTRTIPRASTSPRSASSYIAGLLKYAPEFCAVTNPFVNSYKRLVPGYEAPDVRDVGPPQPLGHGARADVQAGQGERDPRRAPLAGPRRATRTSRSPCMLGAGLKGVEEELTLPAEASNNIFEMTEDELEDAGIKTLPKDLGEAIELFEELRAHEGGPRRAHPHVLRREQEGRVGRLRHAASPSGSSTGTCRSM